MKKDGTRTLFIMSPASGKRVFQISFSPFWWYISSRGLILVFFLAVSGVWSVYQNHVEASRADALEKAHRLSVSRLKDREEELRYLHTQFQKIQEQSTFIRQYLGIIQGDAAGRIGQGGGDDSEAFVPVESKISCSDRQTDTVGNESDLSAGLAEENIARLDADLEEIISTLAKRQDALAHMPTISPVEPDDTWISCAFGRRLHPFTGKLQFHPAIDIAGCKGTPIMAPAKGSIVFSGPWGSMGLAVKIRHDSRYTTVYGHLLDAEVKKGQDVCRGDIIGHMGNSGRSTGSHLHYEVIKDGNRVNPFSYMMDWNKERHLMLASGKSADGDGLNE